MTEYRTDEAFGPVPLWLLKLDISDRAVRLYALLSAERDYGTDMATLGRKKLAEQMRCSLDSLDRAKAELETVGAISVVRGSENGSLAKNVYTIHRVSPGSRMGAATPLAAPERPSSRTGAASSLQSESSSSSKRAGRAPSQISGKRVTPAEEEFAVAVLAVFNEISGRKFASKEAIGKIVLRHREHPELSVDQHRALIKVQFEHPWWKGDPSPSVIYGNGDVFDRAVNGVRGVGNNVRDDDPETDWYSEGVVRASG